MKEVRLMKDDLDNHVEKVEVIFRILWSLLNFLHLGIPPDGLRVEFEERDRTVHINVAEPSTTY
jgi:hypothetical protein